MKKRIKLVKYAMLIVNVAVVLFIGFFVCHTTVLLCDFYGAKDFISEVNAIPWRPQRVLYQEIILLGLLILSFWIREYVVSGNSRIEYGTVILDFFVSIVLVCLLDFNYNGILFWVFANGISYIKDIKGKFLVVLLAVTSFMATNYDLISIRYPVYQINDYFAFYESGTQQYLFAFFNGLSLINLLIFILFCVLVIQEQRGTIDEVSHLYEQLSAANEELKDANNQLEKYADMKEKMGQTKERNRLAREIHDTLGHTLTGISAGVDACIATIDQTPETTKAQLEVIAGVTRAGIKEIRRSVSELRPDALERFSLDDAIKKMMSDINGMSTTKVYFTSNLENLKFDEDEENAVYRVIQESVTNSIRHGHASRIWIRIEKGFSDLRIQIKDDGIGCQEMKKGFGTRHIIERVERLKGSVEFDGKKGFETNVLIPIRWGESYD